MVRVVAGVIFISLILCLIQRRSPGHPIRTVISSPIVVGRSQRGYVSPNEILKSTAIGVKTYNRPDCLKQFIASVRTFAPYITIFVVDDSRTDARMTSLRGEDQGDVYVMLPTDSGTGYGRNRIVETVAKAGFRYLIMADDDFKLTSAETLPLMARYLQDTGADIVAATRCDNDLNNCKRNKGMLVVDQQRNLTILPNVTMYPPYAQAPTCFRSDLVQQFFIGRVNMLRQVQWDDKLKNNDHYDFLLNAKEHALSLVSCTDLRILHEKTCQALSKYQVSYKQTRTDRWYDLLGYMFQKWNLRYMHDEVGKVLWVNTTGSGVAKVTPVQRYPTYSNETRDLVRLLTIVWNARISGWLWIRPLFNKKTLIIRKEYGPCVNLISGMMEYKYDRHKSLQNSVKKTALSQFIYDETCTFAEQFWNVSHHGHYDTQHVYYVTAVANDIAYLIRLLHILDDQSARTSITLIVVIMDKITAAALESNRQLIGLDLKILNVGPPFSRSIGLRVGFEHAIQMAKERGQSDAIGFSIDTSILLPGDFTERIQRGTICSASAFVPIVFKCISCSQDEDFRNLTDGYWVYTGFGMVGLCLNDYTRLGGWNVEWGYRWGAEDIEMMERIMGAMPHVVRTKEEGYMHVRDASVKDKNKEYYKDKNEFPRPLPPCSLTVNVENEKVRNKFVNFIKESIPEFKEMEVGKVNATRTYLTDAKEIVYHVMLTNRHDESDRRWALIHSRLSPVL